MPTDIILKDIAVKNPNLDIKYGKTTNKGKVGNMKYIVFLT